MVERKPLAGLRVADFTWIGAGAYTTKLLSDWGADVIKIESRARLDSLRDAKPFKDRIPGVNRSGYFADRNGGKRSVTLDLKTPRGLDYARRLIATSDIVANNFSPGVMDRLGLGYEAIRKFHPEIIYVAMSMQGATGPYSRELGFGLTISALTGFQHLTGLPDRLPAGTGTNYPDHIPNPCHAVFAILAAVRHRRRTGQGQQIDIAQTEPTIALLGPTILDASVNGVVQTRRGNSHPDFSPHGVYPARGDDRWIAIAVTNDEQWRSLAAVLGLALEPWMDRAARIEGRAALDQQVAERTSTWDASELTAKLQENGVPAGPVQDARDISHDPQLQARGHFRRHHHAEMGLCTYNGPPFSISGAESGPATAAPLLGQDTEAVLSEILGCSSEEIERARSEGALQ